jgi:DNA-binding transcriptional regulator WhiA
MLLSLRRRRVRIGQRTVVGSRVRKRNRSKRNVRRSLKASKYKIDAHSLVVKKVELDGVHPSLKNNRKEGKEKK